MRASLTLYWCFVYELRRAASWPAFSEWIPVLAEASRSLAGLWLAPLPLLLLLLLQFCHPNH
jgi:hypothetical protein